MGRKSLLKSTKKKSVKPKEVAVSQEAERKKAILDGVQLFSDSVKATLEKIGLAQSTYYRWLQRYKAEGMDGLNMGSPVSDKVWKRFSGLKKKQEEQARADSKLKAEEKRKMKSEKENERIKKLLFKRFDEGPSKPGAEKERAPEPAKPKARTEAPSPPSYTPPPEEPMDKTLKYAIGAFAFVLAILLMSSVSNSNKFYFKHNKQMIELWQGRFAPMGETRVASFSDPKILESLPEQEFYTRKQAYGVLSDYLVGRADDILNTGQTPDLSAVRSYLTHASKYALSDSEKQAIRMRLNSITFLVLCGKANLALSKGAMSDFETAKGYLAEAIPFASTDIQKDMITKRLAAIEYAMASSKISKGEKQLAVQYREAMDRHLKRAKEYDPEKSKEIDQEMVKIRKWLEEFDKKHVGGRR